MEEEFSIDFLVRKLEKYPEISFVRNDWEITIYPNNKDGFIVYLQLDEREHTLHFGTFHWHFDNSGHEWKELFKEIVFGLTGLTRIKEYSKNGEAYKWTREVQDEEGNWHSNGTMSTLNLSFWTTPEIKYYKNEFPKELFM